MARRPAKRTTKTKAQSVVREVFGLMKHQYDVPPKPEERLPLLEELALAVLAEDAREGTALRVLEQLKTHFCDWNEVRVSPVQELVEHCEGLPRPDEKARRLKRMLYDVFESEYTYDIDHWLKKPVDDLAKRFGDSEWLTEYVLRRITHDAFGKSRLAIDGTGRRIWSRILGLTSDEVAPLLERAIPKREYYEADCVSREHGNTVCLEEAPRCDACFVSVTCEFVRSGGVVEPEAAELPSTEPATASGSGTSKRAGERRSGKKTAPRGRSDKATRTTGRTRRKKRS